MKRRFIEGCHVGLFLILIDMNRNCHDVFKSILTASVSGAPFYLLAVYVLLNLNRSLLMFYASLI
jgi:hypothetical protein